MKMVKDLIDVIHPILLGAEINDSCGGNGWIAYENEKCFKLIEEHTTRDKAAEACGRQSSVTDQFASTLASIHSSAEQDFLLKNIFNSSIANNIWIDGLSKESGMGCVSLHANKNETEWLAVSCAAENWILCQKLQTVSLKDLQQSILGANKELQELRRVTSQLTSGLNEANKKVDVLLANQGITSLSLSLINL